MRTHHHVENVRLEYNVLHLKVDGQSIKRLLSEISRVLAEAAPADHQHFEFSPFGYGIHWPLIDKDLSIDGLLGIIHRREAVEESA